MLFSTRIPHSLWNPWADPDGARARMHRWMADSSVALAAPPLEAWMDDDQVFVRALVPGVAPGDVDISVEGDTLTLGVPAPSTYAVPDVRWQRRERSTAASQRTLQLPFAVDPARVRARLADGCLEIELPRAEHDKPRRVAVQSN